MPKYSRTMWYTIPIFLIGKSVSSSRLLQSVDSKFKTLIVNKKKRSRKKITQHIIVKQHQNHSKSNKTVLFGTID